MSLLIDRSFITELAPFLEGFRETGKDVYNCRCPYCGDSAKNKNKKRGYIVKGKHSDDLYFYCHNCSASKKLSELIQDQAPHIYDRYLRETFTDRGYNVSHKIVENDRQIILPGDIKKEVMRPLNIIDENDPLYYIRAYAISRLLPVDMFGDSFATGSMWAIINKINRYSHIEPRYGMNPAVVFPYYNKAKEIEGFMFRQLNPSVKKKYIIAYTNSDYSGFYGEYKLNLAKPVMVAEGIFDKAMLNNSIMMSGVHRWRLIQDRLKLSTDQLVIVFDNDFKTNKFVRIQLEIAIERGHRVFIAPKEFKYKDLNEWAVAERVSPNHITNFVLNNSYSGLAAHFQMTR